MDTKEAIIKETIRFTGILSIGEMILTISPGIPLELYNVDRIKLVKLIQNLDIDLEAIAKDQKARIDEVCRDLLHKYLCSERIDSHKTEKYITFTTLITDFKQLPKNIFSSENMVNKRLYSYGLHSLFQRSVWSSASPSAMCNGRNYDLGGLLSRGIEDSDIMNDFLEGVVYSTSKEPRFSKNPMWSIGNFCGNMINNIIVYFTYSGLIDEIVFGRKWNQIRLEQLEN